MQILRTWVLRLPVLTVPICNNSLFWTWSKPDFRYNEFVSYLSIDNPKSETIFENDSTILIIHILKKFAFESLTNFRSSTANAYHRYYWTLKCLLFHSGDRIKKPHREHALRRVTLTFGHRHALYFTEKGCYSCSLLADPAKPNVHNTRADLSNSLLTRQHPFIIFFWTFFGDLWICVFIGLYFSNC